MTIVGGCPDGFWARRNCDMAAQLGLCTMTTIVDHRVGEFMEPESKPTRVVGLCWLKSCKRQGFELVVGRGESGGWRIVLCLEHRALLESSSQDGYSHADPPPKGEGVYDHGIEGEWWPWEPA